MDFNNHYGVEAFGLGSSGKGTLTSLFAKVKDIFATSAADIARYYSVSTDILETAEKVEKQIKAAKGDQQGDVAMIPLGATTKEFVLDGKLLTSVTEQEAALKEVLKLLDKRNKIIFQQFKKFMSTLSELANQELHGKAVSIDDLGACINMLDLTKFGMKQDEEFLGNMRHAVFKLKTYDASYSYLAVSKKGMPKEAKLEAYSRDECLKIIELVKQIAEENITYLERKAGRPAALEQEVGSGIRNIQEVLTRMDKMDHPKATMYINIYNGMIDGYYSNFREMAGATNGIAAAYLRVVEHSVRRWY